jgi:hypothetical protein
VGQISTMAITNGVITLQSALTRAPANGDTFYVCATAASRKLASFLAALGADYKAILSTDAQTGVTIPTVTTLTDAPASNSDITAIKGQTDKLTFDLVSTVNYLKTTVYGAMGSLFAGVAAQVAAGINYFFNVVTPGKTMNDTGGGSGLTAQQTRDAMQLAPTSYAPADNSVDIKLDGVATPGAPMDLVDTPNPLAIADMKIGLGVMDANLVQIDGLTTVDGNAILNLKKLLLVNSDSGDSAFEITGPTDGDGIRLKGNNSFHIITTGSNGRGLRIEAGPGSGAKSVELSEDIVGGTLYLLDLLLKFGFDGSNNIKAIKNATDAAGVQFSVAEVAQMPGSSAAHFVDGTVYVNSNAETTGTDLPNGNPTSPVNNLDDGCDIADNNSLSKLQVVCDSLTLDGAKGSGKQFKGTGSNGANTINLKTSTTETDGAFENLRVLGGAQDYPYIGCRFNKCIMSDGTIYASSSVMKDCNFYNASVYLVGEGAHHTLDKCTFDSSDPSVPTKIYGGNASSAFYIIVNGSGKVEIHVITSTNSYLFLENHNGDIVIHSSCTHAERIKIIGGTGSVTNNGTGIPTITGRYPDSVALSDLRKINGDSIGAGGTAKLNIAQLSVDATSLGEGFDGVTIRGGSFNDKAIDISYGKINVNAVVQLLKQVLFQFRYPYDKDPVVFVRDHDLPGDTSAESSNMSPRIFDETVQDPQFKVNTGAGPAGYGWAAAGGAEVSGSTGLLPNGGAGTLSQTVNVERGKYYDFKLNFAGGSIVPTVQGIGSSLIQINATTEEGNYTFSILADSDQMLITLKAGNAGDSSISLASMIKTKDLHEGDKMDIVDVPNATALAAIISAWAAKTTDGVTYDMIMQLSMAMVNGNAKYDEDTKRLTLYKRNGRDVLTVIEIPDDDTINRIS